MATNSTRKLKDLKKVKKYSSIWEAVNRYGDKEYIVIFTYKGVRFGQKNFTKLFDCQNAKQTKDQLVIVKHRIDNNEDPFTTTTNKIKDLVIEYLETRNADYKRNSTFTYYKWIDPVIGHKYIERVTEKDILKIKQNMIDNVVDGKPKPISESTMKKIKNILSPIFKKAHILGLIRVNVLLLVPMGRHLTKPRLQERLNGTILENAHKIRKAILTIKEDKNDEEYKAIFLISSMCARRLGEILSIKYEDIIDGIVHTRGETTKTYKEQGSNVVERYPLPKEVLDIIKPTKEKTGEVFTHRSRSCMDIYASMIDKQANLDLKPKGKEYPIRTHDNRHFMISLCAEDFGKDNVGTLALSHSDKSNMNDVYLTVEYERVEKLYNYYWKLLRGEK